MQVGGTSRREGIPGLFTGIRGGTHLDPTASGAVAPGRLLPPLEPLSDESPVRTRANWRWMLGTFLTGIAGLALVGGALYTAFDGQSQLAVVPRIAQQQNGFSLASTGAASRGDRMSMPNVDLAIKQIIHESSVTKVGAKEFFQVRPYAHITANLALATRDDVPDLPPFNPLKLFSEAADEGAQEPKQARIQSSGEVRVELAAFAPEMDFADDSDNDLDTVESNIHEALELSGTAQRLGLRPDYIASNDPGGDALLIDATETVAVGEEPALAVEDIAGRVTEIEKSMARPQISDLADKAVAVARGDTLMSLLLANGATPQEAKAAAAALEPAFPAARLKEGNEVRISFGTGDVDGRLRPARISIFDGVNHLATVGLAQTHGDATFIALDDTRALLSDEGTQQIAHSQVRAQLYESLFETGLKAGTPRSVLDRMVRVHSYDVDFKRNVQAGDSLEVFYVADDNEGNVTGEPEVLYSALSVRGETKRFYRFRTPDDGVVDFYDEQGNSAKKFLIRKPINGGVLRSSFGMRRHPILGYKKLHTGVDWAARSGTPIVASGNGVVERAGWSSGYGRYTVIRHANGYKTAYAHQSSIAKDVTAGARVRQGQVIGYVGSTGLSTGPHLHYEVVVNGRYVDPMRIRVPRGRTLQGRMLAAFEREKMRIDRLMRQPPASTRVADARPSPVRPSPVHPSPIRLSEAH